jgi:histidyl-tRNA synthetase
MIIPTDASLNLEGLKLAQEFRTAGVSTAVDISNKKIGKKIERAAEAFVTYALVLGDAEMKSHTFTLKNLGEKEEFSGTLAELIAHIAS